MMGGRKARIMWFGIVINSDLGFSIASCYAFYERICIPHGPPNKYDEGFGIIRKMEVPFRIKAFGWRLLHDRLPTKDLLFLRSVFYL